MQKISVSTQLEMQIESLNSENAIAMSDLKNFVDIGFENLRPANLLKNTFEKWRENTDFPQEIVNNAIGFGAGILAKKIFTSKKSGLIGGLGGLILQYFVSKQVANHTDNLREYVILAYEKIKEALQSPKSE